MGGALGVPESPKRGYLPETKLEAKMVEAMQERASKGTVMKSFNTIILKFPKIDQSFRKCKAIFEEFGMISSSIYLLEIIKVSVSEVLNPQKEHMWFALSYFKSEELFSQSGHYVI